MKRLFRMALLRKVFFPLFATLALSAPIANVQAADASSLGKSALSLFSSDAEPEYLSPDAAFQLKLTATDPQNIRAAFTVAPGYYLYRERIKFTILNRPEAETQVAVTLPAGEIKDDPNFGRMEVYHHDFDANLQLTKVSNDKVSVAATYQGCSEKGLCYAPIKKTLVVDMSKPEPLPIASASTTTNVASNDDATTGLLKQGNLWLIIAGFFGAGLLLSLTPCVLPMIPILSSIIVGQQKQGVASSRWHSFGLSAAYVLGMALSYTLAGIAAGLSGNLLSQSLQNAWVLGGFALVFVTLALSMFGFYELSLPQRFEERIATASNKLKGGKFIGVFVMGALSALIVSPCVAAPLAGALIYIGQSQDVVLGGIALFALSIGMGVPLLLIGASAGSLLPKTGNWMNMVRNFFGVLMLAMAIYLIASVIPMAVQLALWAALSIVTAIYLNALDPLPLHHNLAAKFWKGIAILLLVYGVALLIGALSGAQSALQPLRFLGTQSQQPAHQKLAFQRITSLQTLEQQIAAHPGQPVMLDFYADWCVACKEMEALTFSDPDVQTQLKNTLLLQADVTANNADDTALLKRFGLYGPPGILFFDKQGQEIGKVRVIGFQDVARFSATLRERDALLSLQ